MGTVSKVTHVGLDCHRKFSTLSGRDAGGRVVWREKLDHTDRALMRECLGRYAKGTPVVLEGTFGWGWMSDELSAAGLEPHVASGSKLAGWRKSRGLAKSNKLDANLLSEVWEEKQRWWEVWLAPCGVRDWREWLRYRMSLVGMQTGLKNRIHALLHRHGILHDYGDLFGVAGRKFLGVLAEEQDVTLRDSSRQVLRGYLKVLDQVRKQIAQGTRQFRKEVKQNAAARRLMTLPGVSWVLAYTILAEVGQIERFKNKRGLARYSCLAPLAHDSGEDDGSAPIGRHVGHAGRRTLKWAFIEAAHGAVRKGGRFKEIFDRRTNGGKRDRNRGYVAVGHELCNLTYVLWTKEVDYTDKPPRRPGAQADASAPMDLVQGAQPNASAPMGMAPGVEPNASAPMDLAPGVGANASGPRDIARRVPADDPGPKCPARDVNDSSRSGTGQPVRAMAAADPQGRRQASL